MLLWMWWMGEVSKTVPPAPTTDGKRRPIGGLLGLLLGDVDLWGNVRRK